MVHDNVALKISQNEAAVAEDEAKRRLLSAKKLSLVVDLDQTVIQATVDPTVAEWQNDPQHPNHEAVQDVRTFQLKEDSPGGNGAWYYIKLRPGLEVFLEDISKLYELHIYTMGTRAYARHIAEIIDPDRKIFGNRILSRNENGNFAFKSLQRIFPVDTNMVVIIDDRGDVWNWSENLIRVTPFDFFIGIGDINASFLPKRQEIPNGTTEEIPRIAEKDVNERSGDEAPKDQTNGTEAQDATASSDPDVAKPSHHDVSTLEQLVSMGGGDDPALRQEQNTRQEETIAAQLASRPLLQKQKELEAGELTSNSAASINGTRGGSAASTDDVLQNEKPRHHLLRDDDKELVYLEKALRKIHSNFFETHARHLADLQGGRLAQLRPGEKRKLPLNANSDLAVVPDIKVLLPQYKRTILQDTVIVFSGIKPLHIELAHFDLAILARTFGAQVAQKVKRKTTHVVAGSPRTSKAKQAFRRNVKVVNAQWLRDSVTQWEKLEETPYIMNYDGADPLYHLGQDGDDILSDSDDSPSPPDTEDDGPAAPNGRTKPALSINVTDTDDDSDVEALLPTGGFDDKSPIGGGDDDWLEMENELEDYLAEGDSDAENRDAASIASGTASVDSTKSNLSFRGRKRNRPPPDDTESDTGSPEKKKRGTTLSQTIGIEDRTTGLPTPDITGGEEANGELRSPSLTVERADEGDGWSEFSDDLEVEMEKVAAQDDQGEG